MTDLLILGDYPAPNDKTKEFKDAHGRYLLHLMYTAGVNMRQVAFDFLYDSKYDVYSGTNKYATVMSKHKPKVILALGQQVLRDLGIEGSLTKMRGSVMEERLGGHKYYVVPTYNPRDLKEPARMFADEPIQKGFYTAGDIQKAWTVVQHGWTVPKEDFILEPDFSDVLDFCQEAKDGNYKLGLDIEATGLNTDYATIVTLGIAIDESRCLVIPFRKLHGEHYWPHNEEVMVKQELEELFSTNEMMFQNGVGYDIPLMLKNDWKFPMSQFKHDTMVLHHVISPELPHNIGFISSQYGKQPYWKESFLTRKETIYETDQIEMRTYNARDCVALHQIYNGMSAHIDSLIEQDPEVYGGLWEVYEKNMEASWASIEMTLEGINISKPKLKKWQDYIRVELDTLVDALQKVHPLPPSFNWSSPYHKRLFLYGEELPAVKKGKWKAELEKYDAVAKNYQYECTVCGRKVTKKYYSNEEVQLAITAKCPACKIPRVVERTEKEPTNVKALSKDSKKYKELLELKELSTIEPLYRLKNYKPLTTDKDQSSLDGAAIVRYIKQINQRIVEIDNMKRRPDRCVLERDNLKHTREVLTLVKDMGKYKKLVESFWDFPTGIDGKVHPSFLVTGTATGRWSCKGPNLQQVPSGKTGAMIRSVFKASEGCVLLGADWSNLEVQVGARVFGDGPLIKMLEDGLNMHDENTKIFFGITPEDPMWDKLRKVSKIIMFGRLLYGGSDRGIYTQVMTAVPDCGLTYQRFCEAVQNYMDAHPEFALWCTEVQELASTRSISVNAFKRVRTLLGSADAISRQALNSPIQGSAADVARDAIIGIRRGRIEQNLKSKILLAVHDEIIMEVPKDELPQAYKIMKDNMNKLITVNGYTFRIPIDVELGTYWGDMGAFDEETFERTGGSKHV